MSYFQTAKICGLCDKTRNICWKCFQCDKFICEDCKNIHSRVNLGKDHEMTRIREPIERDEPLGPKSVVCNEHRNKVCELFCTTCEQLTCISCLLKYHRNHILPSVDDIHKEFQEKLTKFETYIDENFVSELEKKEETLNKFDFIHCLKYEEAKRKITEREQLLIKEVKKNSRMLLNELYERWDVIRSCISAQKSKISEIKKDLSYYKNKINESKDSRDIEKMLGDIKILENTSLELISEQINKIENTQQSPQFNEGIFQQESLQQMIGSLDIVIIPDPDFEPQLTILKSCKGNFGDIQKIIQCEKNTFWISSPNNVTKILMEITLKKTKILCTTSLSEKDDMTILKSGEQLCTMKNYCKIFSVNPDGQVKTFKDLSPQKPIALHTTSDNSLLIGVINKDSWKYLNKDTKSKQIIIKLSANGDELNEFEYKSFTLKKADGTNKLDIYDFTWRITTNINEDICIVDLSTSSVKGRIVTLDKDGNLKWVYNGHPSNIPTEHFFLPGDIATTYLGNIIVCDTRNSAIHLLNAQGSKIAYKEKSDLDISYPLSLCCTAGGNLLVGCCRKSEEQSQAIIHWVKLRGL
ncbi:tripartite motif-containing protein 2/3 [Mytilus galloprovincialis]|uniref:Tripartite motif-containing protein 2/3 n=1 Tax=Mytilus galloprovincialis TaxID=29158 RepID=A0A8B6E0B7_MYTGA|nr:tripartite motif-containing protein 2/3 [Mytilus galloprovincialis]